MRFSIIMPAHDAEDRIRVALESIKKQVFKDYELIVVCDACTDNTEEIAKSYGAITKTVDFKQDGYTRNAGIDIAQGEWALFMDDDDYWLHEYVLTQLDEKLKEVPNIDVLCFSFIFKGWMYAKPKGNSGCHWVAVWNKCWRREFIGDTRFSNKHAVSDADFHKAMFCKNPRVYDWDMPMYYYNFLRKGSISEERYRKG